MDNLLGQVVYSKAGRDAGRKFIILKVIDELYVYIVDGKLRKVEKPKVKKIKHLKFTNTYIEVIRDKLMNNIKITNFEIRKKLLEIESNNH